MVSKTALYIPLIIVRILDIDIKRFLILFEILLSNITDSTYYEGKKLE